jgi:hypothetical protein
MTLASAALPLLKVCPLGLNERSLQALTVFFERKMADTCALVTHEKADVALINFDALDSQRLMDEQLGAHQNQPMILMTLNPERKSIPGAVFIQKPVKMDLLIELLKDLHTQVFTPRPECHFSLSREKFPKTGYRTPHSAPVAATPLPALCESPIKQAPPRESHFYLGATPDVDLANQADREKIYYDSSRFLHSFVNQAITLATKEATVVTVSSPAFGSIEIYPLARKAITSTASASLYAASRLAFREQDITISLSRNMPQFPLNENAGEALDVFMWKLVLWASRGRLPAGTDLETPLRLSRWPNLTRLLVPPHATRIAGLWARAPVTLAQSITTLGIEQRYVFAFYSACVAQGLLAQLHSAPVTMQSEDKPLNHEKRSVFRMLMNKLIWNRAEEGAA